MKQEGSASDIEETFRMTPGNFNNRQTGARKFEPHPEEVDRDRVGIEAAENRPSHLMKDVDETMEKTRQSDAVDQRPLPRRASRKKVPAAFAVPADRPAKAKR